MTRLTVVGADDDKGKGGRPSGEFDPWDTERGSEYDVDRFYTRSTNKHDHSSEARFRFPPHLAAMVNEIVQSKRFPQLRSTADFYRDAAVHRLHHVNEMIHDEKYDKAITIEIRLARIEASKQEMEELSAALELHAATLETAWNAGDFDAISDTMAFLEDDIDAFREPYKSKLKDIRERFMVRLRDKPK